MEFIETSLFTKLVYQYLSDGEYTELQVYLNEHPDAGKIMPGSGGIRKLRWGTKGTGKSGGVRNIYYWEKDYSEIWMITIYSKSEVVDIPKATLQKISKELKDERAEYRSRDTGRDKGNKGVQKREKAPGHKKAK